MPAECLITNTITLTNITELTNNLTNWVTQTNAVSAWSDPQLWVTGAGAALTFGTALVMLWSVLEIKKQTDNTRWLAIQQQIFQLSHRHLDVHHKYIEETTQGISSHSEYAFKLQNILHEVTLPPKKSQKEVEF